MNNAYIRAQQCKVKEAKFPFVKIGEQYWTKRNLDLSVTPQGNTIPEMQANGNVEKVVNGDFGSGSAGWVLSGQDATHILTFSGGTVRYQSDTTSPTLSLTQPAVLTIGKWYKITTIISNYVSGALKTNINTSPVLAASAGTTIVYILAGVGGFDITRSSTNVDMTIDNISVQEIGWSGSQELYDGIYAQTSGTVEQKTYAAVKAAAMWSNCANNIPTGLIYGKLYNWFAVKLFQMDIDYYNAANPDKKWGGGFRMPTQAEFQALSTYLGGDAVSGGHLKEAGLAHWSSPNTGADNSSGFSALGGGARAGDTGLFSGIKVFARFWSISENGIYGARMVLSNTTANSGTDNYAFTKPYGYSVRLIKA